MNLYAWTWRDTTTLYTSSSTPSSGDYLYNADGTIYTSETVGSYDVGLNSIWAVPSNDRYLRNTAEDIIDTPKYVSVLSNGTDSYTIKDANAIHSEDVTSTYSPTGTDPVNGTAVKAALDEDYAMVVVDYTAS